MIAIDPGASGAIVFDTPDGIRIEKMPETQRDVFDLLMLARGAGNNLCVIEKVGMHRQGNAASSSVKFARMCERVEMGAICCGLGVDLVTPQKWMKSLGALPKDKKDRKNAIKAAMQMRFPQVKIVLWNADALAIYCWALEHGRKE